MKVITRVYFFSLSLVLIALCPLPVLAQSITITAPTSPVTVNEGDDYATNVAQNPWDFNERRDIGWEENFVGTSVGVSGGVWSGTNEVPGGYVFPIFPGFKGGLQNGILPGEKTIPTLGITKPVDASKYTRLCYKANVSTRSTFAVYWANDPNQPQYWPDGSNRGASYDGYYPFPWLLGIANSGWKIYCFNMSSLGTSFDSTAGAWTGSVHGLRLDLSVAAGVGAVNQLDWVRLVDPNSAPNITVSWSTSGLGNSQMRTLYIDDNNSGYDGTPFIRFANNSGTDPGTYTFSTASLPPGDWYFYVTAQEAGPGALTGPITSSNYSARLRIDAAPQVLITAPSQTSGEEYAASELGNPWDMDSAGDVPNLDRSNFPDLLRQFSGESFASSPDAEDAGKIFQAMANPPLPGNTESDDQVWMNVSSTRPIQAGKYRYLAYRIAADPTNFPTIVDKVRDGWVTRPIWWNNDVVGDGGDPGAHVLYEGWHTYAYDLWTLPMERGIAWTSNSHLKHLRIDPLETNVFTWFFLDWVRLYAENHAIDNQYTITWNIQDSDNSSFTTTLFYDNDKSGFNGTQIAQFSGQSAGSHSHVWNTTGLPNGASYYIYAVVSDGTNTTRSYSPVHIVIGDFVPNPVPRTGRAEFDYNGDALSDLALFTPAGTVTVIPPSKKGRKPRYVTSREVAMKFRLSTGQVSTINYPPGSKIFGADINGDKLTDLLTVRDDTVTNLKWFTGVASRTALPFTRVFGLATDSAFKSDFNGDGIDEIGVFRNGEHYVMNNIGEIYLFRWGTVGDVAVNKDYDGDGTTDLAIWRPADGNWWVINSGFASGYADTYAKTTQWGLFGDVPVPADYDGDGRDDRAVWRPTDGNWYINYSRDGSIAIVPWGHVIFGDIPFSGLDLNGDSKADFVVYRPAAGLWFIRYSNGATAAVAHGTANDSLPVNKN